MTMEKEDAIMSGKRPVIPAECPSEFASLMRSCWAAEPETRPSFSSITSVFLMRIIGLLTPELVDHIKKAEEGMFRRIQQKLTHLAHYAKEILRHFSHKLSQMKSFESSLKLPPLERVRTRHNSAWVGRAISTVCT